MKDCIFCRIIRREIPADILYRDELVMAFLDIAPINPGHALVIPLDHHTSLTTVPERILGGMMSLAARLGPALMRVTEADAFNLHLANGQCAGQVVDHTHLHVVPRSPTDGFSWHWRTVPYVHADTSATLADAVRRRLEVPR